MANINKGVYNIALNFNNSPQLDIIRGWDLQEVIKIR